MSIYVDIWTYIYIYTHTVEELRPNILNYYNCNFSQKNVKLFLTILFLCNTILFAFFHVQTRKVVSQLSYFLPPRARKLAHSPRSSGYKCGTLLLWSTTLLSSMYMGLKAVLGEIAKMWPQDTESSRFLIYFYFWLLRSNQILICNKDINTFLYLGLFLAQKLCCHRISPIGYVDHLLKFMCWYLA